MKNYDLEERLLEFSVRIIKLVDLLAATRAGNHVGNQLLRSGTAVLPNHGEAQAAESRRDFVHKMSVCLKELRESWRCLRLISEAPLIESAAQAACRDLSSEADELIRIFVASIRTAKRNDSEEPGER